MYYVKRQKGLHLDLTLHEIKNFHMVMKERGRKEREAKGKASSLEMKTHIQLIGRCEGERPRAWASILNA